MIRFAIWLLVIAAFAYGIYRNYKRSANLVKKHIDQIVIAATAARAAKDKDTLDKYYEALCDYGRQYCVDRPWFGLYEYYIEARIHVEGLMKQLSDESFALRSVTRRRGVGAAKV